MPENAVAHAGPTCGLDLQQWQMFPEFIMKPGLSQKRFVSNWANAQLPG